MGQPFVDHRKPLPSGTVTILFTDIEASTKLARENPDTWETLRDRHHSIIRNAIESNGGFVFQIMGDAFYAAFHQGKDGLQTAIEAQRKLRAENWGNTPIKVRMGLHTGAVELDGTEYRGYLTLSLAQRLMSAGHGGQILLSDTTEVLIQDNLPAGVFLRDMGEHKFKDFPQPVRVYQVVASGLETEFPPLNALHVLLNNLPTQLSSFIGRKTERKQILELIAKHRLVTLTGMGGIGKTRLAVQVGSEILADFPAGVWLVEFAPISEPARVPWAVASSLGLVEQAGGPPYDLLIDTLRSKQALLLLDNCEHLVKPCAELAKRLLQACPRLHLLITSREMLNIPGEIQYTVPSLATTDLLATPYETLLTNESVQLFLERAKSARREFSLSPDNAEAIVQICQRLDGIPLAIELAAARVNALSVEEIATRLDDRFRLLTGGARTALPRHQTLRGLIDWSYELLSEPERVFLRRLSVFAGGWSLEAAEYACADEELQESLILDLLWQLVNKSLVISEQKSGQETRYQLLETLRQYSLEKLAGAGEEEFMRQNHAAYFLYLTERAETHLRSFGMVAWLDRLETELDNLRVALEWAHERDVTALLRMASALLWFWHIRGHKSEGVDWLEQGLSLEAAQQEGQLRMEQQALTRGKALNASGELLGDLSYTPKKAQAYLEESLALFKGLGPAGRRGVANALWNLGVLAGQQSDMRGWEDNIQQSLEIYRQLGDLFGIAECYNAFTGTVLEGDDYQAVRGIGKELLALRRKIGDLDGIAQALANLGVMAFGQDDYPQALKLYQESLDGFRTVGNYWATGFNLSTYGDIHWWMGDDIRAAEIYQEALDFAQSIGDQFIAAANAYSLGIVAWGQGDYAGAVQKIHASLEQFREGGFHWGAGASLHNLGDIALSQGDVVKASDWYGAEIAFGEKTHLDMSLIFGQIGLSNVALAQDHPELAIQRLLGILSVCRQAGFKPVIVYSLYSLGRAAELQGDTQAGISYYQEALKAHRQLPNRLAYPVRLWRWLKVFTAPVAYPIAGLAELLADQSQAQPDAPEGQRGQRAAHLFAAAEALFPALRWVMTAKDRQRLDQSIAALRISLGAEEFQAAWEAGLAMPLEQAL